MTTSMLSPRLAALLLTVAAGSASALPSFTFNPGAVGLSGSSFTADNLVISDFATITNSGSSFTDVGYLSIVSAQLGGSAAATPGLNSSYGLYIQFSGAGSYSLIADPTTSLTAGTFTSLNYTIYGYNGTASFGFSGNTPTTTATGAIALATGTLITGTTVTYPNGDGSFTPAGSAKVTLSIVPGMEGFFQSPDTFYNLASTAFSNTSSQIESFANGFRIRQGGGTVNFATAVPEPESYALLAAGLGVVGWMARRRKTAA